jgi:hypothetical protein
MRSSVNESIAFAHRSISNFLKAMAKTVRVLIADYNRRPDQIISRAIRRGNIHSEVAATLKRQIPVWGIGVIGIGFSSGI